MSKLKRHSFKEEPPDGAQVAAFENRQQQVKMASHSTGGLSKVARSALLSFFVTIIFVTVSFSTNSWLATDGELENPPFTKLGNWPDRPPTPATPCFLT